MKQPTNSHVRACAHMLGLLYTEEVLSGNVLTCTLRPADEYAHHQAPRYQSGLELGSDKFMSRLFEIRVWMLDSMQTWHARIGKELAK